MACIFFCCTYTYRYMIKRENVVIGITFFLTDGNQLTWNEPLPILTVEESDANQVVHRNHTRLTEGTINASLSWYFNLSSGLFFNSLNLKLKTDVIAVVNSRRKEVLERFRDKYAINWIPSQRITLLIFKVTTEQNATFACEVFAIDTFTSIWKSHVQVDVVGRVHCTCNTDFNYIYFIVVQYVTLKGRRHTCVTVFYRL